MKLFSQNCVLLPLALLLNGCAQPQEETTALSYSEAITIYNQELDLLDRLKKEQSDLRQDRAPRGFSFAEKLLDDATDLQEQFNKALDELDPTLLNDSSDLPSGEDKADSFGEVREQVRQLREESEEDVQAAKDRLEELDKEIAEQEKRVQQAKDDLEAARVRGRGE